MLFRFRDRKNKLPGEGKKFSYTYTDYEASVMFKRTCPWCGESRMVRKDFLAFEEELHKSVCRARNREVITVRRAI